MRHALLRLGSLALLLGSSACSDAPPTAPDSSLTAPAAAAPKARGPLTLPVTGTLPGGTFVGDATITGIDFVDGVLTATGTLTGTATAGGTATPISGQAFTAPTGLLSPDTPGACDILFLDLGPIHLDLLGVDVDLSQIILDLDAIPGSGNLLGNLLCAVSGLLDQTGLSDLLDQITGLLEDLLGILSPATGALEGGGTFAGTMQLTGLSLENGQLVATGVLNGVATVGGVATPIVNQAFEAVASLIGGGGGGGCDVLHLDLAPLHLDLLGLDLDLSQVVLDIDAETGSGKLLGNLLCAVFRLLDPAGGVFALLERINDILGG